MTQRERENRLLERELELVPPSVEQTEYSSRDKASVTLVLKHPGRAILARTNAVVHQPEFLEAVR